MTKLSRRSFLKGTVALGASAVLYQYADGWFQIVNAAAGPEVRQMRLIHTNDHHSRIEPAPNVTLGRVNNVNQTRNLGGVARRKTLFDQISGETAWTSLALYQNDRIFLDAGDVFQGTLYFNQFNGAADLWFYNRLGYAAQTLGNHEFDKGDQILADYIKEATFPIVAANMTVVAPSPLAPLYTEVVPAATGPVIGKWGKRTIVTLPSGEKVGIFGLITVETKNIASPSAQVTFDPEYAIVANAQAAALRAAGCKTVIALTHIGFAADTGLAPQLRGVNIIVGGHSHTPLLPDTPDPKPFGIASQAAYPQLLTDADGNQVLVVQDWEWAKWVGDLVIGFDADGRVSSVTGASIKPVWADGILPAGRALLTGEGAEIPSDPTFQTQIDTVYKPVITALSSTVVGATTVSLPSANVRAAETELGNFLAEGFRAKALELANDNPDNLPVVAIINGGGIRTSIDIGLITVGEILAVAPFGNTLSRLDLTGAQLKAALENGVSALRPGAAVDSSRNAVGSGRFPNVAGLRYTFTTARPAAQPPLAATSTQPAVPARKGERILKVEVLEGTEYKPLDLTKKYRVITNSFMFDGGDGYSAFTAGGDLADPSVGGATNRLNLYLIDADIYQEYIAKQPGALISPKLEGRIVQRFFTHFPAINKPAAAAPALEEVLD